MTEQKPFYEIEVPKKTTETAFILITIRDDQDIYQCQHFVTNHKLCSQDAMDQCSICGAWICYAHFDWTKTILIDIESTNPMHVNPCKSCSTLPDEDLLKIRALRLEINQ